MIMNKQKIIVATSAAVVIIAIVATIIVISIGKNKSGRSESNDVLSKSEVTRDESISTSVDNSKNGADVLDVGEDDDVSAPTFNFDTDTVINNNTNDSPKSASQDKNLSSGNNQSSNSSISSDDRQNGADSQGETGAGENTVMDGWSQWN